MSTFDWPTTTLYKPQTFGWGYEARMPHFEAPLTGSIDQGIIPFAAKYTAMVGWPGTPDLALQQRRLGLLMLIATGNRVRFPNFSHLAPAGTMRGNPVVASTVAQGGDAITLTTATSGETLYRGDLVGLVTANGVQVVTVTTELAVGTGTALTFSFKPNLRAQVSIGTSATWNAPAPTWFIPNPKWLATFRPKSGEPLAVDFMEIW